MKNIRWVILVALSATEVACQKQVTRINGPSESKEGVRVELVSIECRSTTLDPEWPPMVDIAMRLAVTNGADRQVQFYPERVRLIDSLAHPPASSGDALPVRKGERRIVDLHFAGDGTLDCRDRMKVDAADSLTIGEAVRVEPIGFISGS